MHRPLRDRPILPAGPSADCTADSAGGLTFDVDLPGRRERWDAALLLGVRGAGPPGASRGPEDCVRLPFFPAGESRLRAAMPSTMTLGEGHWDGYLVLGDGRPRRLRSGRHDLRSLVDREPSAHRTWLGVRIPYATRDDRLSLRAWLRWPHAEVRDLQVAGTGLTLRGRLYGAGITAAARLEARPRNPRGLPDGGAPVVVPVTREGPDFVCALPYTALPGPGKWDLWLRPADAAQPVRVARILDDVADKERALRHLPHRLGRRTTTVCWTEANDLAVAVRLDDGRPGEGPDGGGKNAGDEDTGEPGG